MNIVFNSDASVEKREAAVKEVNSNISNTVEMVQRLIVGHGKTPKYKSVCFSPEWGDALENFSKFKQRIEESTNSLSKVNVGVAKYFGMARRTIGVDNFGIDDDGLFRLSDLSQELKIKSEQMTDFPFLYSLGKNMESVVDSSKLAVLSEKMNEIAIQVENFMHEQQNLSGDEIFQRFRLQYLDVNHDTENYKYDYLNYLANGGISEKDAHAQIMSAFVDNTDTDTLADTYAYLNNQEELVLKLHSEGRNNVDIDNVIKALDFTGSISQPINAPTGFRTKLGVAIESIKLGRPCTQLFQNVDVVEFREMLRQTYKEKYGEDITNNLKSTRGTFFLCSCLCTKADNPKGLVSKFHDFISKDLGFIVQTKRMFNNCVNNIKYLDSLYFFTPSEKKQHREYSRLRNLFRKFGIDKIIPNKV